MKLLAASHLDLNYFVFTNFHSLFFICFILSAFSVGESGLKSSQDSNRFQSINVLRIFHPKLQEFLGKATLCLQQTTNLADR